MVGEERSQADREHGGREEEEQDVELGLSVGESVLRRQRNKQAIKTRQTEFL